ncbi:hypothetical protein [Advenella sp. S44]|nr:hypothetical protein [Advenella sp. S44]
MTGPAGAGIQAPIGPRQLFEQAGQLLLSAMMASATMTTVLMVVVGMTV